MKVAIIGAAGKMGSWFASYFAGRGHDVVAYDVKPFSAGVARAKSVVECVRDTDLAMICVPVRHTPGLIHQCASMKAGSVIAEISSVKSKTFPALKKVPLGIETLCIHPMFGPGASEKKQLKVLLVPVRDVQLEMKTAQGLFGNMAIKPLPDARTHDRAIAAVLGLTYFVNVAFAGMMSREKLQTLKEVGGTTFGIQSMLAESVMTDEPELILALLRDNPYSARYIKQYLASAQELTRLARGGKLEGRLKKTKAGLQKQQDLQASYRRMYEMLDK
ncbi:MAG: prephenate dehydrogenase/arogenate dehydrogenase family protein [Nitrososphaera sp.]|uniref:prephenate dehydrogenase/arogenate dehydrogenase family protein n=1 Tax=Nitrososphaera sp. TaxID=1971748 RepID=UPI003D6E8189